MTRDELEHIIRASAGTHGRVGYCLDVADLFMSKAVAAREKGLVFYMALLKLAYVSTEQPRGNA